MQIMCLFLLENQMQAVEQTKMLLSALHGVNSCGIHIAVPQDIGKPAQVFFQGVKGSGEEVAQIVGKDLFGVYPG